MGRGIKPEKDVRGEREKEMRQRERMRDKSRNLTI